MRYGELRAPGGDAVQPMVTSQSSDSLAESPRNIEAASAGRNRSMSAASRLNQYSTDFIHEARRVLYDRVPFLAAPGMFQQSEDVIRQVAAEKKRRAGRGRQRRVAAGTGGVSDSELKAIEDQVAAHDLVTGRLVLAVCIALISQFLVGYNLGVLNAPEAVMFPGHTVWEWSLAVSSFAIGAPFGSLAGGLAANRHGRAGALKICAWIYLVGGVMLMLAPNISFLILARWVCGFAAGFATVHVPVYLGEISPPILRGAFGTCAQIALVSGLLACNVLAFGWATEDGWRYLLGVTAVLALVQLMLSQHLLESPRWLLTRKDPDLEHVRFVLGQFLGLRDDAEIEEEIRDIVEAHTLTRTRHQSAHSSGAVVDLLRDRKVRLLLVCSLVMHASQQLCGINAVFYYSTDFFRGVMKDPVVGTVYVAAMNVAGTWFAQYLMDKTPRRTLVLLSAGGMLASLLCLSLALAGVLPDALALIATVMFVFFFAIGLGPIPWLIVAEMFDAKYVTTAQSVSSQVNWVANFLCGVSFPYFSEYMGPWAFAPYMVMLGACLVFTVCYMPETLHRTVEELQFLVNGPDMGLYCEVDTNERPIHETEMRRIAQQAEGPAWNGRGQDGAPMNGTGGGSRSHWWRGYGATGSTSSGDDEVFVNSNGEASSGSDINRHRNHNSGAATGAAAVGWSSSRFDEVNLRA